MLAHVTLWCIVSHPFDERTRVAGVVGSVDTGPPGRHNAAAAAFGNMSGILFNIHASVLGRTVELCIMHCILLAARGSRRKVWA